MQHLKKIVSKKKRSKCFSPKHFKRKENSICNRFTSNIQVINK